MGALQEVHSGNGITDKLGNRLLTNSNRIPYVQMNGDQSKRRSSLYFIVSLLLFLGISGVLLLVVIQDEALIRDKVINSAFDSLNGNQLEWDELVFTQLWGYTSCVEFKDKHFPKDVTCRFENKPAFWSIHGIWPSRGGEEGPSFCSKVKFDINQLSPIRSSLDEYWYEIDNTKQGNYFWSHEWEKHGSCAKELDAFGTELKYFGAGLDLRKKFDLYTILKDNDVVPQSAQSGSGYSLDQITNSITKSLGASAVPYVQCLSKKNKSTNQLEHYMLAVELCFDKDLNSIECRKRKNPSVSQSRFGDNVGPCPPGSAIHYADITL